MDLLAYPRTQRLEDEQRVHISLDCYCHTCRLWHRPGSVTPDQFSQEVWEWHAKHVGHDFEFLSPRRRLPKRWRDWLWSRLGLAPWWVEYRENTNFKLAYTATTAFTISLASVGSNATFTAGRESTAVDNSTSREIDSEITVRIMTGTTPVVDREIRVYGYQAVNADTPTYPDTLTGTNNNVTLTSTYMLDGGFVLLGATAVSATSNLRYPIKCLSTGQAWGREPKRWGLYVAHSTNVALNATGSEHLLNYTSAYLTDT